MSKVLVEYSDTKFWTSEQQAETLAILANLHKGGMGAVYGYRPSTDYIKAPLVDIQLITRFSTSALYERKLDALSRISFSDVEAEIKKDPNLAQLTRNDQLKLFNERMSGSIESLTQTLDGDRSGAHREGHDRCYVFVAEGVKVHLDTEKRSDGLKYPIITDGYPTCDSIMLTYLELNRTYREQGEKKVVNSGNKVRMSNCIESLLNKRSVGLRTLSLKEGNFEKLVAGRKTITKDDVSGYETLTESFKEWFNELMRA